MPYLALSAPTEAAIGSRNIPDQELHSASLATLCLQDLREREKLQAEAATALLLEKDRLIETLRAELRLATAQAMEQKELRRRIAETLAKELARTEQAMEELRRCSTLDILSPRRSQHSSGRARVGPLPTRSSATSK